MRKIHKIIFLGNGEDSQAEVAQLHLRLDVALTILSGLQQPRMATEPPMEQAEKDRRAVNESTVKDIAKDLVCALLGPDHIVVSVPEVRDRLDEIVQSLRRG